MQTTTMAIWPCWVIIKLLDWAGLSFCSTLDTRGENKQIGKSWDGTLVRSARGRTNHETRVPLPTYDR